jgi:hypothetical protein
MSYFRCEHNSIYYPFGKGGKERLQAHLSNDSSFQSVPYLSLPITNECGGFSESQNKEIIEELYSPAIISRPQSESAKILNELCDAVLNSVFQQQMQSLTIPSVSVVDQGKRIRIRYFTTTQASEYILTAEELKRYEASTGTIRKESNSSSGNTIDRLELKGMYGIGITWSDGAVDIYPYHILRLIIDQKSSVA